MSILRFLDGKPKNGSLCVPAILALTTTFFPSWRMYSMVSFRSGKVVVSCPRTGCEIEESKQIRFHRRKFRRHDVSSLAKAPPLSQTLARSAPEEQPASRAARSHA